MVETYRLSLVRGLEEAVRLAGFEHIAGVDEVGRGCLAGPVTVAAVVLPPGSAIPGVDDSKRLSPTQRERLAAMVRRCALGCAIVSIDADTIDRVNILQATRLAMTEALWELPIRPDMALIDAVGLNRAPCPTMSVVRGDSLSYSIACASIVAKVERDRQMRDLGEEYPQYCFAAHKGYAAPAHLTALEEYGPTPQHRLTFRSVVPRLEERRAV